MEISNSTAIHENTYDEWLSLACECVLEDGNIIGNTKELLFTTSIINYPKHRYSLNFERKHNIYALLAETLWVLVGKRDIGWLSHYLPRASDFSDNGLNWRAGYGGRLRHATGCEESGVVHSIDQLQFIYNTLSKDPNTRQAVITIWDPVKDVNAMGKTKDIPCNNWLHFIHRNGYLYLHVSIRSNDLIWGDMINQFEWSMLLDIMAGSLGMKIGSLVTHRTSLHIYDRHFDRAQKIRNCNYKLARSDNPTEPSFEHSPLHVLLDDLNVIYEIADIVNNKDQFPYSYDKDLSKKISSFNDNIKIRPKLNSTFGWILTKTKDDHFNNNMKNLLNTFEYPESLIMNLQGLVNDAE